MHSMTTTSTRRNSNLILRQCTTTYAYMTEVDVRKMWKIVCFIVDIGSPCKSHEHIDSVCCDRTTLLQSQWDCVCVCVAYIFQLQSSMARPKLRGHMPYPKQHKTIHNKNMQIQYHIKLIAMTKTEHRRSKRWAYFQRLRSLSPPRCEKGNAQK